MQIIKTLSRIFIFLVLPASAMAQTQYFSPAGKEDYILQRLEIKTGNPDLMYSTVKPMPRRQTIQAVEQIDSLMNPTLFNNFHLSKIDRYNMQRLLMNNSEWSKPRDSYKSDFVIFEKLYKTKGNLLEVNNKDLFLVINPVLNASVGKEKGNPNTLFLNTRGIALRGMISRKVGFHLQLTDNQERAPMYVQRFINERQAVPGQGFYKLNSTGTTDYFEMKASVSWNVAKFIDMQFGYDKNFIGDGYRSLFLSDFSNNALFLKINTRIWKFNYENLFFELYPKLRRPVPAGATDSVYERKYARMSHLSINATKWLNVGLFEGIMFGRKNHFDFQYLIPVMFLRPMEQHTGSGDNAVLGINAKANIRKRIQLYGQLMLDEFKLSELTGGRNWWANKYGYQVGLKYIDAFGLKNVDIQLEDNRVRPFTYSHYEDAAAYTHYNQPFAHPLGANFQEYIGIVKAQPYKKLYLQAKVIHYYQGLDSAGLNMGASPFELYTTRPRDYGFKVGGGDRATCTYVNTTASYEIKENLFIEGSFTLRNYKVQSGYTANTNFFSIGIRWNAAKREFDF
jgi:hypothetical protein